MPGKLSSLQIAVSGPCECHMKFAFAANRIGSPALLARRFNPMLRSRCVVFASCLGLGRLLPFQLIQQPPFWPRIAVARTDKRNLKKALSHGAQRFKAHCTTRN